MCNSRAEPLPEPLLYHGPYTACVEQPAPYSRGICGCLRSNSTCYSCTGRGHGPSLCHRGLLGLSWAFSRREHAHHPGLTGSGTDSHPLKDRVQEPDPTISPWTRILRTSIFMSESRALWGPSNGVRAACAKPCGRVPGLLATQQLSRSLRDVCQLRIRSLARAPVARCRLRLLRRSSVQAAWCWRFSGMFNRRSCRSFTLTTTPS